MAYGVKYQLLCKGKNGITSKTVISELDYTGAEIDRNIPVNPFRLRKDNAGVICGTSLEFGIRESVDFEFLQFYTNDPKKFLVEFYYPSTTLIWSGYINPQQYSADYKPVPNTLFFQATDGLGLLKNEPFTLTGLNSELTIIRHCLDKIGLGIGYAIAVNIWEVSHNTSLSVLAQTYQESVIFSGKNCYEIIEAILGDGKYDATLTQWNNKWRIVSYKDKKSTRMLYTSAGVYDTTEAAPAVQDIIGNAGSGNQVWPINYLQMDLKAGGKSVALTHAYRKNPSLLENYDFVSTPGGNFASWTKSGTFAVVQREIAGKKYAHLSTYANNDTDYISQTIDIEAVSGENFVFEVDFSPLGYSNLGGYFELINMVARVSLILTVGASVYYLSPTLGWTVSPTILSTDSVLSSAGAPTWNKFSVITGDLPGSGTLEVRLHRYKASTEDGGIHYLGMAWSEPSPQFLKDGEEYIDVLEDTANFDDSTEPAALDSISVLSGDAPDLANKSLLYVNITRLSDGTPTLTWNIQGNDTDFSLIDLFVKMLASRNIYPRQRLTGSIRGANVGFESLIKHAYNSNREFEIFTCTWNVYTNTWEVTLVEWFAWSDQDVTYDSGRKLLSAANLTVASVTPASTSLKTSASFNTTIHLDNTGESAGRNFIEWKIVDGSDNTQSSGTHVSGSVPAGDDEDHVIAMTTPATGGTYYVKARMITDTSWVSSAAITVREFTAASSSFAFDLDEDGSGVEQYIQITVLPDATVGESNDISAWATVTMDQDTNRIKCYPNSENTGATRSGSITLTCSPADNIVISVSQAGVVAPEAFITSEEYTLVNEAVTSGLSIGSTSVGITFETDPNTVHETIPVYVTRRSDSHQLCSTTIHKESGFAGTGTLTLDHALVSGDILDIVIGNVV